MSFYTQQLTKIREELRFKDHILEQVIRSKAFIDQHFAEPITLDDIAREACLSKFHFLRLFKSLYGITPHHYLRSTRIRKAKHLLHEQQSVTDTCFSVGFDSVTSFAGLFKRTIGVPPADYRKKAILKR